MSETIPSLGFGTWNRDGDEAFHAVLHALSLGYRHIDTAQAYGNEKQVGDAVRQSDLLRSELFLTTKVDPANYAPGHVGPSVELSLEKLGVAKVDLLLLHFPSLHDEYEAEEYVSQFAKVHEQGLCRFVGVSNFTKRYLDIAISILGAATIFTNQVEVHAYMQNRPIVDYCNLHDIRVTAYSPLARGKLLGDPVLAAIASKHQITVPQVALAFLLNEGFVVIPSSSNRDRAADNLLASRVQLDKDDMILIRSLDRGLRLVDEDWCPDWD